MAVANPSATNTNLPINTADTILLCKTSLSLSLSLSFQLLFLSVCLSGSYIIYIRVLGSLWLNLFLRRCARTCDCSQKAKVCLSSSCLENPWNFSDPSSLWKILGDFCTFEDSFSNYNRRFNSIWQYVSSTPSILQLGTCERTLKSFLEFLFNFLRNFFTFLSHFFISASTQLPKMPFVCGSWSIHAIVSCPMNCTRGIIHATERKR